MVARISERGVLPFLISLADRVEDPDQKEKKGDETRRRIRLSPSQREQIRKRTVKAVKAESKSGAGAFTLAGAGVGAYLGGPAGALFGGAVGGVLGLLSSLFKK
jgi:hypothetical protein